MIETLIEAERALTHGLIDQAERLYRVVRESDPKNSIAVMGLARVALERGDDATAYLHGRAALAIDPDNPAAQHLVMRLTEVMAGRGETVPEVDEVEAPAPAAAAAAKAAPTPAPAAKPPPAQPRVTPSRPGVVKRLLSRRRKSR
jgi:thioredoxin-like negative regulator of GroEL